MPPPIGAKQDKPLAQIFAEFASALYAHVPDEVLHSIRPYVLDSLAVMVAGSVADSSTVLLRALVRSGSAQEGTVGGVGKVASFHDAALLNGAFSHALELDDDHRVAVLHPGAVVVPAALAACEQANADGRRFLCAVLAGYEVMCRLGLAFRGDSFQHGLHPTALFGVFGAATAASVGMDLSTEATTRTLGIAGTQACGLTEWRADGSWIKRLHPGRAAQSGVLSASLASGGFTGPATILEGSGGFFRAFSHGVEVNIPEMVRGLGIKFHGLDTAIKPYPCCRFMHGAIDLAIEAYEQDLRPHDIRQVKIRIYETGVLGYHKTPINNVDAQFNVPYGVACALAQGSVGLDDYTDTAITRRDIVSLCQRIDVAPCATYSASYPDVYNVEMVVEMVSGETHLFHSTCPSGDPQADAYIGQPDRLVRETEQKAISLLEQCGFNGRGDILRSAVRSLPQALDLQALFAALRAPSR
ncbi:MmgE/PrpD family protein [Pollutimonas bauzanensis]|uniref:MmgE/PrpD family protein n=1 Tax=Pollutimonas bauzanensis TaxID=658167 RepID=UPI00333E4C5B